VFFQNEVEQSRFAFDESNVPKLSSIRAVRGAKRSALLDSKLSLPGYEMILKAAHTFNLPTRGGHLGDRAPGLHRPDPDTVAPGRAGVRRVARSLGFRCCPNATVRLRHECDRNALRRAVTEELPPKALWRLAMHSPRRLPRDGESAIPCRR